MTASCQRAGVVNQTGTGALAGPGDSRTLTVISLETNLITICRSRDKSRFRQVNKLARPSRIEGIGPFHCEAGLTDLRGVRRCNAGELCSNVVSDVEVAVRASVI